MPAPLTSLSLPTPFNQHADALGQPHTPQSQPPTGTDSPGLAVKSADLLRGQKAVAITHNGFTYRLQATRLGKLILTK